MFKKLSLTKRLLLFFNLLLALSLFLGIVVSYTFSSFLTPILLFNLFIPVLVVANIFFIIYWLLGRKKYFLISFFLVLVSFLTFGSFYKIGIGKNQDSKDGLSLMTYNVWGFNKNNWIKEPNIGDKIIAFVKSEDPDVICFQEHSRVRYKQLMQYRYRSETPHFLPRITQAIFSKYPIINEGSLNLPDTRNNVIYADIVYKSDTVRVYNVHLQSYNIVPSKNSFSEKEPEKNYRKIINTFKHQMNQVKILENHKNSSPYPTVLCGDLNNTQFSNVYRIIKGSLQDTYLEQGSGFGCTYDLKGYPMRIDYIFADDSFEVVSHQNYDVELSDHYPIMAKLRFKSNK